MLPDLNDAPLSRCPLDGSDSPSVQPRVILTLAS